MSSAFQIAVAIVSLLLIPPVFSQTSLDAHLPVIERAGFKPVAPAIRSKTRVPILMPSVLPKGYEGAESIFCTVTTLKPYEYEVIIGTDSGCRGGNACRIGSLNGKRSRRTGITGTENYPFVKHIARRVKLRGGVVGYFIDFTCGANCSDSKVFWKLGGYEYMVGLKVGKIAEVVALANSAIASRR